jgi:heme/copper-type cytochrome/quinol oxidase subunit 4
MTATRAWMILIAAALASWALTERTAAMRIGTSLVILIAAVKIRLVIAHFMELRFQPSPWRMVFEGWTFAITTIILGGYWLAELSKGANHV